MNIQPYLFFEGRCEEAIEFYRKAIGAELLSLMRYKEMPTAPDQATPHPPALADKVMHATLRIGETVVMISDGRVQGPPAFEGFALSLNPATEAEGDRLFAALKDGGSVMMPMAKTFWSPRFGMVTDRFGVLWMINVGAE